MCVCCGCGCSINTEAWLLNNVSTKQVVIRCWFQEEKQLCCCFLCPRLLSWLSLNLPPVQPQPLASQGIVPAAPWIAGCLAGIYRLHYQKTALLWLCYIRTSTYASSCRPPGCPSPPPSSSSITAPLPAQSLRLLAAVAEATRREAPSAMGQVAPAAEVEGAAARYLALVAHAVEALHAEEDGALAGAHAAIAQ
jgi:hypothetical protein